MIISRCQVNHITNPMGFRLEKPVFSWTVEDSVGKKQLSARIIVRTATGLVADTQWADLDSLATQVDVPLAPRTRHFWTVAVRTDAGEETVSDVNWFETGKLDEPWQAKWIGCDDSEPRHPLFSKEIMPKGEVSSARLYICGLGLYEAFWNGEKIGCEYLTPYCNNYNSWVQYQTYDVTEQICRAGMLSVLLGNGWYKGRFGFEGKMEPYYGSSWKLLAELHLSYADGTHEVIGTDESWTVTRSKLTFSNIYDGEWRDDTLPELPTESARMAEPPVGNLMERLSLPVTVQEEMLVKELIHTPAGETVLDIGQNMTGSFRLKLDIPKGKEVRLQFGEILQNGNFYRENLRSAQAEYRYVSNGKPVILEPHFTFYGYRYVNVEGVDDLQAEDFTALVLHSDIPKIGTITTGHPLVNQLISNAEWGQKGNFLDVPTDCPQRDERMGWTGDAQVFAATACYQRDSMAFYDKFLFDVKSEQDMRNGMVPVVVPSFGLELCATAWGDAACIIPMTMYRFSGDLSILRRHYGGMKAWVDYLTATDGEDHAWRSHFHYGDWLALDGPEVTEGFEGIVSARGSTDVGFIADTYYLYSSRLTAQAAELLGYMEDEEVYHALSERILRDINEEYFSSTGRLCVDTQTGYILALRHGLGTNPKRMKEGLLRKLKENGGKLQTGFVGTPLLCEELTRIGAIDKAYDLLLNEEYPGWLYSVKLGATTIWERWNSVLEDGSISSTGMNSLNHYSYGSVLEWMYSRCAGIVPLESGFRKVKLQPMPDRRLGFLDTRYNSQAGLWGSSWRYLDDGKLEIRVTVPFGCMAEMILPGADDEVFAHTENPMFRCAKDGVCVLEPGQYAVSYYQK